jgi:hypothetical protein
MPPSPLTASPEILSLLKDLHTKSLTQESTLDWQSLPQQCTTDFDSIMLDKFIALDQDKCELVYHILRSINAKTVVEAGTSFGVSTIYLALAVAENAKRVSATTKPRVIATEKEESKAKLARAHWATAGKEVEDVIDLRVGDLRETLTSDLGTVDFLLLDSKCIFSWAGAAGYGVTYSVYISGVLYPVILYSRLHNRLMSGIMAASVLTTPSLDASRPPSAEARPAASPTWRCDRR